MEYVRDLTLADVEAREAAPVKKLPVLAKLRASHHEAAKAIAEGLSHTEVSLRTGYHPSRISMLMNDPAFADLVETYKGIGRETWLDAVNRARVANVDLLERIMDKVEEDDDIPLNTLTELYKATGKLAGMGLPAKSEVNVNVNLSGRLEAARRRAQLIEGKALPLFPSNEEPIT